MKNKFLYLAFAVLAALFSASCQQEYEIIDELSVTTHRLNIAQTPGSTHIPVYSTGSWKVALAQPAEWASLDRLSGEGMGDFVFSWSANYGIARSVDIVVSRGSRTETITVIQAGNVTSPYISLGLGKLVLPRQATTYTLSMNTNLGFGRKDFKARAIYRNGSVTDTLEIGNTSSRAWVTAYTVNENTVDFTVGTNDSGADRSADIVFYATDAAGVETRASVAVTQSASDPEFVLESESGEIYANGQSCTVASVKNNIWALPGVQVNSDADWVKDASVTSDGLVFTVEENTGGADRSATLSVSYTSPEGLPAGASYTVTQSKGKLLSFAELRSRVPGKLRGNEYIEGFIVSDPSSANVCSSPQTGQFSFDRSENFRTAYIESVDGLYGFCLKFTDASENKVPRWARVLIKLEGLTLVRENNPVRFTIGGLASDNITVLDDQSGFAVVPVKEKMISQLSNDDIYTFVTLQSVEIMCKDGAYTNASEGYCMKDELNPLGADAPRWDVAPLLCSDVNGDVIFMLTNAAAPWRRTGGDTEWYTCVRQGSGNLRGVIVADVQAPVRWGDLGRFQIRPIEAEDIELADNPFSNTICEWNWNDFVEKLTPDIGVGKGHFYKYDAASKFIYDYNNPFLPTEDIANGNGSTNLKGLVSGGAVCLTQQWWDFENNEGKYIDVKFSTAGLSGTNLVFGIVWGHGSGSSNTIYAPSHWKVLYSVNDGKDFSSLPSVEMIKQRSCAWWSSPQTSQDATPGYTEHLVKLPASCFGKSNVVVRLQVKDTVTDIVPSTGADKWSSALGIEKGTLSPSNSCPVRIGTITVRYN